MGQMAIEALFYVTKLVLVPYSGTLLGFSVGRKGGQLLIPLLVLLVPNVMGLNSGEHYNQRCPNTC
jgi:hypothetical protein